MLGVQFYFYLLTLDVQSSWESNLKQKVPTLDCISQILPKYEDDLELNTDCGAAKTIEGKFTALSNGERPLH